MPNLTKTVYTGNGSMMECAYESEDQVLAPFWITVFIVSLLLNIFAVFGNTVVVIACFLQRRRPPHVIYIHALAISDLLYAVSAPLYIYRYVLNYMPQYVINFYLMAEFAHHVTAIANIFSSVSCWLVVALTIDRVILTKLPFRAPVLSTRRRATLTVLLITICCTVINAVTIYVFFEVPIVILPCLGYWKIPEKVTLNDGISYKPILHQQDYHIYDAISTVLFFYALPTIILIVCNIIILRWVRGRKIQDKSVCSSQIGKRRIRQMCLSQMTIVVSVLFIICNMPDVVTRLLWRLINPLTVAKIEPISHLFLMVNVAANFFVYSLFNKYLFRTLIRLLRRCVGKHKEKSSAANPHSSSVMHNGLPSSLGEEFIEHTKCPKCDPELSRKASKKR